MTFFGDIRLKRNALNQKMVKLVDKMKWQELTKSLT